MRVKVYGLFSRTRCRYVIEAISGAVVSLMLFLGWWLGWPALRQRLTVLDLPSLLQWIVTVLDWTPWILLAAALWKGMEVLLVMRSFSRKEASNRSKETITLT